MHTSRCFGTTAFCSKLQMQPMHMLSQSALQKPLPGRQRQRAGARLYSDSGSRLLHVDCGGSLALWFSWDTRGLHLGSLPTFAIADSFQKEVLARIVTIKLSATFTYLIRLYNTIARTGGRGLNRFPPISGHGPNNISSHSPTANVALDEMMPKFKGRSAHTVRIPSEPILEGYKILDLCGTATCRTPRFLLLHAYSKEQK